MNEGIPTQETASEAFPTEEQVLEGFDLVVRHLKSENISKEVDEEGLKKWHVRIEGDDGDSAELIYRRGGKLDGSMVVVPSHIYSVFYNTKGSNTPGREYQFKNGTWEEVILGEDPRAR